MRRALRCGATAIAGAAEAAGATDLHGHAPRLGAGGEEFAQLWIPIEGVGEIADGGDAMVNRLDLLAQGGDRADDALNQLTQLDDLLGEVGGVDRRLALVGAAIRLHQREDLRREDIVLELQQLLGRQAQEGAVAAYGAGVGTAAREHGADRIGIDLDRLRQGEGGRQPPATGFLEEQSGKVGRMSPDEAELHR
jgi:hypothetical protein